MGKTRGGGRGKKAIETTSVEKRRQEVASMYLRGMPQAIIAETFEVAQQTISKDLQALRKRWLESALRDFDELKAQELAKIEEIELAAWQGYARSCGVKFQNIKKKIKSGGFDWTDAPDVGDKGWLDTVFKCVDKRCKIFGFDAPTKVDIFTGHEEALNQIEADGQVYDAEYSVSSETEEGGAGALEEENS